MSRNTDKAEQKILRYTFTVINYTNTLTKKEVKNLFQNGLTFLYWIVLLIIKLLFN